MSEWMWTIIVVGGVLLLFGAKRIPEVMRSLGQGVKEFKKAAKEITTDDDTHQPAKPAASASRDETAKPS